MLHSIEATVMVLSRPCAFTVSSDLHDELTAVDHISHEFTLHRPPAHLMIHEKDTGAQVPETNYTLKAIHAHFCHTVNTCCTFLSSIHQHWSKAKCVIQIVSMNIQQFIAQSNQYLLFSFHLIWHFLASLFTCLRAVICSYVPVSKSLTQSLTVNKWPWTCSRCSSVCHCRMNSLFLNDI